MVTARQLQILKSADDPEEVQVYRTDVIAAALKWDDACNAGEYWAIQVAEAALSGAIYKYRRALKRRRRLFGTPKSRDQ